MPSFFLTKSNRVTKKAALSKEIEIIAMSDARNPAQKAIWSRNRARTG